MVAAIFLITNRGKFYICIAKIIVSLIRINQFMMCDISALRDHKMKQIVTFFQTVFKGAKCNSVAVKVVNFPPTCGFIGLFHNIGNT